MRLRSIAEPLLVLTLCPLLLHAEDAVKRVRKSILHSTLNQPGTKPFHLKAEIAPTKDRDRLTHRTGAVEIWWQSPTQWKREVRSPEFHQVEIVDGAHDWQHNEGTYFPDWLRNIAVELVNPVPQIDAMLAKVKTAEMSHLAGSTYYKWTDMSTDGVVSKGVGATIALSDNSDLLFYGGSTGWGGMFHDFKDFHGRMVPQTVSAGSPEVTARFTALEDLRETPPGFFDTTQPGGDPQPIQTVVLDEPVLRKSLEPGLAIEWPAIKDGPLEGVVTTKVVIDRQGKVRDTSSIVSDNPGISDAFRGYVYKMQFKPVAENGVTVQVVSRITMPFKTVRPAGTDTFASAISYFQHGRELDFPAAGKGAPYLLKATFKTIGVDKVQMDGRYEDTWQSPTQWRREAWFANSHLIRTRNGDKAYTLSEGPDARLLQMIFRVLEPIPGPNTIESDWRIRYDTVDTQMTIRVLSGYESPDGKLDPEQARGFWFDPAGHLVQTHFMDMQSRRMDFQDYAGIHVARRIEVRHNGGLAIFIRVNDISAPGPVADSQFVLKGHEVSGVMTSEAR